MGSISAHVRKQEVTRKVRLSPPDSVSRARSATAYQKQTVTWDGPVQALFGYSLHDVEDTEDWWLDRIHPNDRQNVIESLSRHLSPAPGNASAAESRIWRSDYRFRHADGSYILTSDRATTTRDRNGNASCLESVIYDKEVRRNERDAHAKVFKAQDHLALIAANTPSGIYMMDPQVRALTPNQPTLTWVSRAIVFS
jgi:PAS fold